MGINVNFPGPGTAALFGSALVFFGLALTKEYWDFWKWWPVFGAGATLLIVGIWIEAQSFGERSGRLGPSRKEERTQTRDRDSDGLEKLKIRATVAVGAIAFLYYMKEFRITVPYPPPGAEFLFGIEPGTLSPGVGTLIMSTFGLYILAMTIAISDDMLDSDRWRRFCRFVQEEVEQIPYVFGVSLLIIFTAYVVLCILLSTLYTSPPAFLLCMLLLLFASRKYIVRVLQYPLRRARFVLVLGTPGSEISQTRFA